MSRAQYLLLATRCGLTASEAMHLCPGVVFDLCALRFPQQSEADFDDWEV